MKRREWVVNVPLVNLRKEPRNSIQQREKDPLQETQLLFGERVYIREAYLGWVLIEALEQPKRDSSDRTWKGYPGWMPTDSLIQANSSYHPNLIVTTMWATICDWPNLTTPLFDVPFGTRLASDAQIGDWHVVNLPNGMQGAVHRQDVVRDFSQALDRKKLLEQGRLFVGFPYLWGGLSAFRARNEPSLTGVDCSGLVHVLYRFQGITIPRDAHDQFLFAEKIPFSQLKPGDPIFLREKPHAERISHVMLFAGGDQVLEATMDSCDVRLISAQEKLGRALSQVPAGEWLENYRVDFGAFLPGD